MDFPKSRSGASRKDYKYQPLNGDAVHQTRRTSRARPIAIMVLLSLSVLALFYTTSVTSTQAPKQSCDTIEHGYVCDPKIAKFWGQYSLYYSVPSEIPDQVPPGCSITFANMLSRHGARDPSASKTAKYNATIAKLKKNVKEYKGKYAFLKDVQYTLGADELTTIGRQQLVNSGIKFHRRYVNLAKNSLPFVRTAGQNRVVESAQKWIEGYASEQPHQASPALSVIIPEERGVNNTLSHGGCYEFEDGAASEIGDDNKAVWASVFLPPIQARLNKDLAGANFTLDETLYMMDLCPFETVADPQGSPSAFCNLFTENEFHQYDYYETLDKWYGYGNGNPLGPTQGVGYANELIARLTRRPVVDHTTTNSTLDNNDATFPLNRTLYADFSHDNDLAGVYAALGLYNSTTQLSNSTLQGTDKTNGYSASWAVPFGARAYFEKMQCAGQKSELVRIVVNDRVIPLKTCNADIFGRCTLDNFVNSLSFATSGGRWNECGSAPA
ncbi:acid phosphatase [Pseudovirgaria hyperparasitica]|uniref:Phytase A n=1 Tax=Pseudovirgaria hyperparasitica TaxID=470096 RepID=A0A6A6W9Z4_9PEZI|nr:acid phosphatase [Pseudovirgaria hyperparasitica]KAF2758706.1 acid phosphatase [Pseudovirgaria hyperparasitica]